MHIFFSGIGGAGIGPLALIAHQAGYKVSGSDKQDGAYIAALKKKGIVDITIGQTTEAIAARHAQSPIDWVVFSSAVPKENPNHPELVFATSTGIRQSKRDEILQKLLQDTGQKMVAIAGTHGKTTTTAMVIWLFKELGLPLSYSVGGKLSFGGLGEFTPDATYFVYEADEYDRNFLSFTPAMSLIAGIDYDHPDIYPTREEYYAAFNQFLSASSSSVLWQNDADKIKLSAHDSVTLLDDQTDLRHLTLAGHVNRLNAHLAVVGLEKLGLCSYEQGVEIINRFPGVSRRFEKISDNLYTDYAHTPEKIRGALQLTNEIAGDKVVVVYEGLHNTRQHFIKDELPTLFGQASKLYIVPSYLAREDQSLELLTPEKLRNLIVEPSEVIPSAVDDTLKEHIQNDLSAGKLVLGLSAGGGGSLDEWLRQNFTQQ